MFLNKKFANLKSLFRQNKVVAGVGNVLDLDR